MLRSIVFATALLAVQSLFAAPAGSGNCAVTHQDCYPACVKMKMTPDGEDCAQTKTVCREVCGEKPVYNQPYEDQAQVVPQPPLPPQGKVVPTDPTQP